MSAFSLAEGFTREFRFGGVSGGRPPGADRPRVQRSNISMKYAPNSSRWTQPSSTLVRGRENVSMLVNRVKVGSAGIVVHLRQQGVGHLVRDLTAAHPEEVAA